MEVRFGDCELSVERIELRRAAKIVDMEPQVFDALAYLLRYRERVVPKTGSSTRSGVTGSSPSRRCPAGSSPHAVPWATPAEISGSSGPSTAVATGSWPMRSRTPHLRARRPAAPPITNRPPRAQRHRRTRYSGRSAISGRASGRRSRSAAVPGQGRRSCSVGRQGPPGARRWPSGCPLLRSRSPYRASPRLSARWPDGIPDCSDAIPAGRRAELEQAFAGRPPTTRQQWFAAVRSSSSPRRGIRVRCSCSMISISRLPRPRTLSMMWHG